MKLKKALAAVLSAAMIVTSLPAAAFAKDEIYPPITGPALGSENLLENGKKYVLGENGVPSETDDDNDNYNVYYHGNTVEFKNATLKTPIYVPGGTTIKFEGTNVSGSEDEMVSTCIQTMTEGDLTITGDGSYTGYASSGDGIITGEFKGNIIIDGGNLDLTNIKTGVKAWEGNVTITGNAEVKAKNISTGIGDIEIKGEAKVEAEKLDASNKVIIDGDSRVDINGTGIYGSNGIEVTGNAEVSSVSTSVPLNAFYGPITINSTKKLTAKTTIANGAAIAAGVSQATEATDVTIKSEVEVEGSVGIAASGTESKVVIDGGNVTVKSSFIGLYTQADNNPGTVEIKNGAKVKVIGAGNATPGIATFSGNPQPINIENSTVEIENCGFGLSGSEINLKESNITVSSTKNAFLKTPTLNYEEPVAILAGESADSAEKIPQEFATAETYQNKYVKIIRSTPVDVDVDVKVDVDAATAGAEIDDNTKEALSESIKKAFEEIQKEERPAGFTEEQAKELRTLLRNPDAFQIKATLTVSAALQGDLTDEQKEKIDVAEDETAQVWNLSVQMTTTAKDAKNNTLQSIEKQNLTETEPIVFQLTTGQDFTGKSVRVLFIHNEQVETAQSSVADAENGIVNVTASKFSPYIILSKVKPSSNGGSGSGSRSYEIVIADKTPTGGKVGADRASASKGAKVTVTVTPEQGFQLDKVTVTDKNGEKITVTKKEDGKYIFTMPASKVTVSTSFKELDKEIPNQNDDDGKKDDSKLPADLNSKDHIAYVSGYEDGTVKPNNKLTRAETAAMLYRLLTEEKKAEIQTTSNSFRDVSVKDWYNEAVSTMANGQYISSYEDGSFRGNKVITRAEFIAMLVRFVGVENVKSDFTDLAETHWAYQYISTAANAGWISGYEDGSIKPEQQISRAEAMAIINRVLNRGVNQDSALLNFKIWSDNDASAWYYYDVIEATNEHEYTGSRPSENWTNLVIR